MEVHGWECRTSALLLVCMNVHLEPHVGTCTEYRDAGNKPMTWYFALSGSPAQSMKYLREELSVAHFTANVTMDQNWIPFNIPVLVHQILEKKIQYVNYVQKHIE